MTCSAPLTTPYLSPSSAMASRLASFARRGGRFSTGHSERHTTQSLELACPLVIRPAHRGMQRMRTNPSWARNIDMRPCVKFTLTPLQTSLEPDGSKYTMLRRSTSFTLAHTDPLLPLPWFATPFSPDVSHCQSVTRRRAFSRHPPRQCGHATAGSSAKYFPTGRVGPFSNAHPNPVVSPIG